jgi:hypothetical protein
MKIQLNNLAYLRHANFGRETLFSTELESLTGFGICEFDGVGRDCYL